MRAPPRLSEQRRPSETPCPRGHSREASCALIEQVYTCLPNLGDNFIFVAQVLFIYLHGGLIVPWGMYGSPYLPDPARVLYIPPSDLGSVSY